MPTQWVPPDVLGIVGKAAVQAAGLDGSNEVEILRVYPDGDYDAPSSTKFALRYAGDDYPEDGAYDIDFADLAVTDAFGNWHHAVVSVARAHHHLVPHILDLLIGAAVLRLYESSCGSLQAGWTLERSATASLDAFFMGALVRGLPATAHSVLESLAVENGIDEQKN